MPHPHQVRSARPQCRMQELTRAVCSINGEYSSGALMHAIRYCAPLDDHELGLGFRVSSIEPVLHRDTVENLDDFQRLTEDHVHALLNDIVGDADISAAISHLPTQPTYKCVTRAILYSRSACGRYCARCCTCYCRYVQLTTASDAFPLDHALRFSSLSLETATSLEFRNPEQYVLFWSTQRAAFGHIWYYLCPSI